MHFCTRYLTRSWSSDILSSVWSQKPVPCVPGLKEASIASDPLSHRTHTLLCAGSLAMVGMVLDGKQHLAPTSRPSKGALATKCVLVIDTTRSTGCGVCEPTCQIRDDLPEDTSYIYVRTEGDEASLTLTPISRRSSAGMPRVPRGRQGLCHARPIRQTHQRQLRGLFHLQTTVLGYASRGRLDSCVRINEICFLCQNAQGVPAGIEHLFPLGRSGTAELGVKPLSD